MAVMKPSEFSDIKRTLSEIFEYEAKNKYEASKATGVNITRLKINLRTAIKEGEKVRKLLEDYAR